VDFIAAILILPSSSNIELGTGDSSCARTVRISAVSRDCSIPRTCE
jgi:hypothetical protein